MRRNMPTEHEIREHWSFLGIYGITKSKHPCFACQLPGGRYKCHVLAKCEGGSDDVDNIHMLCKTCHDSSEYLSGKLYWEWFDRQSFLSSGPVTLTRCGIDIGKVSQLSRQEALHVIRIIDESGVVGLCDRLLSVGIDISADGFTRAATVSTLCERFRNLQTSEATT